MVGSSAPFRPIFSVPFLRTKTTSMISIKCLTIVKSAPTEGALHLITSADNGRCVLSQRSHLLRSFIRSRTKVRAASVRSLRPKTLPLCSRAAAAAAAFLRGKGVRSTYAVSRIFGVRDQRRHVQSLHLSCF